MICASGLTKDYGPIHACSDVSFTVAPGEVTALLGPNGAGKSTVLKIISGILVPSGGSVKIGPYDMRENQLEAKAIIGSLFETSPLYPDMTVADFLSFALGMRGISRKDARDRVESVIARCALEEVARRRIGTLSRGYRQRVGLAQALAHSPKVLVLDEPTAGLDPIQLDEFRAIIRSFTDSTTILLSTHIMQEVEAFCDSAILMHRGALVARGSLAEIRARTGETSIERAFLSLVSRDEGGISR